MNQETPFNQLTPAEVERLALLAEECAEVIQIVGKILRHGYTSTHPDNEEWPDNKEMLETEIGHIDAARQLMINNDDVDAACISKSKRRKLRRVDRYLHHQSET